MHSFVEYNNEVSNDGLVQQLLSSECVEEKVVNIMSQKNLEAKKHSFFVNTSRNHDIHTKPKLALNLARHWEKMTKTFMFTTFQSLAKLSEQLDLCDKTEERVATAFLTGLEVITDDINNHHQAFSQVAPKGISGMHYKWWHEDIVSPLAKKLDVDLEMSDSLMPNVEELIQGMRLLAKDPMGFSVQLRVVEDIALHIAVAFMRIFSTISDEQGKAFFERKQLSWIISHIKAEVAHQHQVADVEHGVACIAVTHDEQKRFLETVDWYAGLWEKALEDFNVMLLS